MSFVFVWMILALFSWAKIPGGSKSRGIKILSHFVNGLIDKLWLINLGEEKIKSFLFGSYQ